MAATLKVKRTYITTLRDQFQSFATVLFLVGHYTLNLLRSIYLPPVLLNICRLQRLAVSTVSKQSETKLQSWHFFIIKVKWTLPIPKFLRSKPSKLCLLKNLKRSKRSDLCLFQKKDRSKRSKLCLFHTIERSKRIKLCLFKLKRTRLIPEIGKIKAKKKKLDRSKRTEAVFLNFCGAQESIPRTWFRQPMPWWAGAHICRCLRSLGIDSEEQIPPPM